MVCDILNLVKMSLGLLMADYFKERMVKDEEEILQRNKV